MSWGLLLDSGGGREPAVTVDPFWMDVSPVTNQLFGEFVAATGYVTEAERFGWSYVFWTQIAKARFGELVEDTVAGAPRWCKVRGAWWRAPAGPGSGVESLGEHTVVHVSWGDKLRPQGEHRCTIWQGEFPKEDTAEDGYAGTCPVEAFPPNDFGLFSVSGNTWEWCADWFSVSGDDGERTARVMKGGSFLCHKSYCNRYRVGARSSNTPDSSTSNIGFRCVFEGR